MSKQILRSSTFVGAMVTESECSESKSDLVHKLSVAQKELNETLFWLDLLFETNYIEQNKHENMKTSAIDIMKILVSSIKTVKSKLNKRVISD